MSTAEDSLATVEQFIAAYNNNVRQAYEEFTTSEFEWMEAPTQFSPAGRAGGHEVEFAAISEAERTLRDENLEILSSVASGDAVALECLWRAVLLVDMPDLPKGSKLALRVGAFYRVKDGKIMSAHEYLSSPVDL